VNSGEKQTLLRIIGQSTPGACFFVDLYTVLGKMLQTCVSMTFPDFQRQIEW